MSNLMKTLAEEFIDAALAGKIAGSLYDFMGYLTSLETPVTVSKDHGVDPILSAFSDWWKSRFDLDPDGLEPEILDWNYASEAAKSSLSTADNVRGLQHHFNRDDLVDVPMDPALREADDSPSGEVVVFVFETLMNQELRQKLLHRDVRFEVDAIPNFKEITTNTEEGDDYNTVIPYPGSEVKGHALYLTPDEASIFDEWEAQYEKTPVILASGTHAYVYILKPEFMRDYGKNTAYALSPDDIDIIARDIETTETTTTKGVPVWYPNKKRKE